MDSAFRIQTFSSERVYEQAANKVWEPGENNSRAIAPESIKTDQFILRRKFAAREYALFAGRMLDGAYGNLFAFRVDSSLSGSRLRLKFYSGRGIDYWYRDIEDIYFLGDLILAGQPLLFFKEGSDWRELKALPRKPMRLVLRSQPPGARVSLDGKEIGTTPIVQMGLVEPHVTIRMELPGFYTREEPVGFGQVPDTVVDWKLGALLPIDSAASGDSLPLSALTLPDAPSIDAYEARQDRIRAKIGDLERNRAEAIAKFDSLYPPLKRQEEFERSSEFSARKKAYENAREGQQAAATAGLESRLQALYQADRRIEANKEPLEKKLVEAVLVAPILEMGRYDADHEKYPFKLRVSQPPLWFHYAGKLALDRESAQRFKAKPDSLLFKVRYWNLRMRVDSTRVVSPSIDSIYCGFEGRRLRIFEDTIAYPPSITSLPAYFRLQNRVQDFAKDRTDEAARTDREKAAKAVLANKAKWRKVRLYSGLGLTAISLGAGAFAYSEKVRADRFYADYRAAMGRQQALEARHAAEVHDKQAIQWWLTGGTGLTIGAALSVF